MNAARTGTLSRTPELVVARYGELWLKGRNRRQFEAALERNVRNALEPLAPAKVHREYGQLVVVPEARPREVLERMCDVFGLSTLSPAWRAERDPDDIARVGEHVLGRALARRPPGGPIPFRVETKRADKSFPMISTELDRHVAEHIGPEHAARLRVDLTTPELVLGVRVQQDGAYVFCDTRQGAGGLPVGTVGRVVCLLSGGIDSPVAAWLAMKRGCEVSFATFHSSPYLGEGSRQKVLGLARELMRFQSRARFHSVPFAEIQEAIRDTCNPRYRTVLYRRAMQRISARIAARERAGALVTGESLGQVASQTLENLSVIGSASDLPVLRPLIAYDKQETIALARRIGTYELSIRPEPDCCTVFQPDRPVIHGREEVCREEEAKLDLAALIQRALAGTETVALAAG